MTQDPQQDAVAPVGVEISDTKATVTVRWADGHSSRYPNWYLRGYCPCAVCQGHSGGWDFVADVPNDLADVAEVGHYALNFVWRDQHRTGIYAFPLLRRLCPCADCRQAQGKTHPWARIPPGARRRPPPPLGALQAAEKA
jgi:DUF971 family protein